MARFAAIRETLSDDEDQRTIAEHTVLIEFTLSPIVPATYWQPAEGGELEFIGADVKGNGAGLRWVKLRPCDPLYQWAEAYLYDPNNYGQIAGAVREAEREEYYERGDREYHAWKDQQMERGL